MFARTVLTAARRRACPAVLLALAALGCGDGVPEPTRALSVQDVSKMYWALTLDHRAVTLSTVAPYDTIQLAATLRDAAGEPLPEQAQVTFRTDNSKIALSPDGQVRALGPVTAARVIAEAVLGNVRHVDTALVTVTTADPVPVLDTFELQVAPSVPVGTTVPLTVRAIGTDGTPIPPTALNVSYRVSDPHLASVNGSRLQAHLMGEVTVIGTTTLYGVTRADTATVTVAMRLGTVVTVELRTTTVGEAAHPVFVPSEVEIAPGGYVIWSDRVASTDVIFDDPTNVVAQTAQPFAPTGTGNIAPFGADSVHFLNNFQSRAFPVPGIYEYHSTLFDATARIVVTADAPTS